MTDVAQAPNNGTPGEAAVVEEGEVTLRSKDNQILKVPVAAVKLSKLIKDLLDDNEDEDEQEVPVPNVDYAVLVKIMEFCKYHLQDPMTEIEKPLKSGNLNDVVDEWYSKYINVDQPLLFNIILGANYLDIQPLLDLACAKVASMIKGKSPEEIRQTFNIVDDFTPEEKKQIEEENKWCEEM